MTSSNSILVATIVGWFGLKGYFKVHLHTYSVERLKKLKKVFTLTSTGEKKTYAIEDVLHQHKSILVKLKGIDDRTSAEPMKGTKLFIGKRESVKPPRGKFFVHDIVGCSVYSEEGTFLGIIDEVIKLPAQDVWSIRNDNRSNLIPVVKEFVKKVDTKNKTIVIHVIEGLIQER